MTTKPATPLPYWVARNDLHWVIGSGDKEIATHLFKEDALYLKHAANAYPELIAALREYMAAQERLDGRTALEEARGRAALRELLAKLGAAA